MKVIKNTAATKLLNRFDKELRNLLTNDLRLFADNNIFSISTKRVTVQPTLYVA
jgi:hypothetical protein